MKQDRQRPPIALELPRLPITSRPRAEAESDPPEVGAGEPGLVAASVYADGRRIARHPIDEAGTVGGRGRPRRLDRLARAVLRAAAARAGPVRAARPGHRGRRQAASAAQARAIRRRAVHRRPHRAARRRPRRLRRDASLRRPRLRRDRPPRRLDLLRGRAPALGVLPDRARQGRGLHPLRDPRLHRRQLHAGRAIVHEEVEEIEDRVLAQPIDQADIERLYMLRRDLLRLRNAAAPLVEVCRRLSTPTCCRSRPAMQLCSAT